MSHTDLILLAMLVVTWAATIVLALRLKCRKPRLPNIEPTSGEVIRIWNNHGYKEYKLIDDRLVCTKEVTGR